MGGCAVPPGMISRLDASGTPTGLQLYGFDQFASKPPTHTRSNRPLATVTRKVRLTSVAGVALSVTLTVTGNDPVTVGDPEMMPVDALMVRPGGSAPALIR